MLCERCGKKIEDVYFTLEGDPEICDRCAKDMAEQVFNMCNGLFRKEFADDSERNKTR